MDRASSFDATNLPENFNQKRYGDAQVNAIAQPILRIVELKMVFYTTDALPLQIKSLHHFRIGQPH